MPTAFRLTTALSAAALLLAGCYPGRRNDNSSAGASEATPSGSAADQQVGDKVNAYTEAYNKLIGTFGLPETAQRYAEDNIPAQSPGDSISITDGWIDQALAKLREARAKPGAMPALDRSADALIAALDKVMARLGPLDAYYSSRAYKDDGLARGRREDPLMRAEFAAALADGERFNTALTAVRHARLDGELRQLREAGDTLGYNTKMELKHAEDLLALFPDEAAVRNPATYARADALVATLERLMTEQRAAYDAAKARATPTDQPAYGHIGTVDQLTRMVGSYREMREDRDPSKLNSAISAYNSAISTANTIRFTRIR